ncbi:uncharacterized protein F5891DRAFT_1239237 [Suillus fuscotomentosus]|uniref:DUF6533 domain-containing protein n=1 Tax=Suillus fuscotomentosus TaxID=1912939 RepID=A0AAD4HJ00_9AGAM|nr:uncharacterized protein F5891DRAFT_1239237 [Suillus fuscotomentosus]KAG1898363.1 hypothetical protein F5891DRAFT_1239237 [Suillus fuscotomentosus]
MTVISNDPTWWPIIDAYRFGSYFIVAACVSVAYDWALIFGQEVELIWRRHWSLMTVMYLGVRYLGILYAALYIMFRQCSGHLADRYSESSAQMPIAIPLQLTVVPCSIVSFIVFVVLDWTGVLVTPMLWVIIIARLYAMYQGSRNILIYLIVVFLAVNIFSGVANVITTMQASGEELILSGTHHCLISYGEDMPLLVSITWILVTVWEVLALCLAVRIAVKHFRELRQHSAGGIIEDCFTVLIKTHVLYFASFVAVSCFHLILAFSPTFSASISLDAQIMIGFLQNLQVVQMFVLGPRLILGVREYHAKLVADSDVATGMASIAFQERVQISTGSGV